MKKKMSEDWELEPDHEGDRCSYCDGTGEVVTGWEYPSYDSCPECDGSGRVRSIEDLADELYERRRDG